MRITKMLIGLLLVASVACTKSEKETPSGLKFKIVEAGDGKVVQPGEGMIFNFIFKDSKDSVWRSTYELEDDPYIIIRDTALIKTEDGMSQMIRQLSQGDSVVLSIHIKDFFKDMVRQPIPPGFDTTLTFTYLFKVDSIISKDSAQAHDQKLIAKRQAKMRAEQLGQLAKDTTLIAEYLAKNNLVAQKSESGIWYIITKPGKGPNGVVGQTAGVNYAGYTLDGRYFDTNIKSVAEKNGLYSPAREAAYKPYDVKIGRSQVISGWHEALKLLNKGAKAKIFIPSGLAYGVYGKGPTIPPNTVLAFDIEVADLKDANK